MEDKFIFIFEKENFFYHTGQLNVVFWKCNMDSKLFHGTCSGYRISYSKYEEMVLVLVRGGGSGIVGGMEWESGGNSGKLVRNMFIFQATLDMVLQCKLSF